MSLETFSLNKERIDILPHLSALDSCTNLPSLIPFPLKLVSLFSSDLLPQTRLLSVMHLHCLVTPQVSDVF